MNPPEIVIPVEAVRRHSVNIDNVAAAVHEARSAAHAVTIETEAYGQICSFLPTLLNPLFALTLSAYVRAEEALQETSVSLRTAAARAEESDKESSRRINATSHARPRIQLPL